MMKKTISEFKINLSPGTKGNLRIAINKARQIKLLFMSLYGRHIATQLNLRRNLKKDIRMLEIGPGEQRIENFETVNVVWTKGVDYVADASERLPFPDNTFSVVYASHVLEHTPWYRLEDTIKEWWRITAHGGKLEIFVPNGLLIAQTFVEAELEKRYQIHKDGWYKFNEIKDPCVWANGRIFSYGDGTGLKNNPNWHFSLFSPRFLTSLFERAGFVDIKQLSSEDVRGYDHGWINLGFSGRKP